MPPEIPSSRSEIKEFTSKNADFPDNWQIDSNGILLRRCFEEISLVENWYGNSRNYMFSMLRKTSREWLEEQVKDKVDGPIVTLELLEKGYSSDDIAAMLSNEGNPAYIQKAMTDMELCKIIDRQMIGRFHKDSVYGLSESQKKKLADEIRFDLGVKSEKQISRCLAMRYGTMNSADYIAQPYYIDIALPSKYVGAF